MRQIMEERTVIHTMVKLPALEELDRFDIQNKFLEELVKGLFTRSTDEDQKLDFTQLSAALSSLQVNLVGVLLDAFRAHMQPVELQQTDKIVGRHLWERLQQLFPDVSEQRLAFLLFHCNLSPSDILRYVPQEFKDK